MNKDIEEVLSWLRGLDADVQADKLLRGLQCLTQAQEGREGEGMKQLREALHNLTHDAVALGMLMNPDGSPCDGFRFREMSLEMGKSVEVARAVLAARPIPSPGAEDTKRLNWLESALPYLERRIDTKGNPYWAILHAGFDGHRSLRAAIDAGMSHLPRTPEGRS
jgi:hypothetical protein